MRLRSHQATECVTRVLVGLMGRLFKLPKRGQQECPHVPYDILTFHSVKLVGETLYGK
jgi:hypothetical protein